MLALGTGIALPSSAVATVTGWTVNWCVPGSCDPSRTYYQGMSQADFKARAISTCNSSNNNQPVLANEKGGFLQAPEGFFSSDYFKDLRWVVGEPNWCGSSVTIPARWYSYDPVGPWKKPGTVATQAYVGASVPNYTASLTMTCLTTAGVIYTNVGTGTSVMSGGALSVSSYANPNTANKTSDGRVSYIHINITTNATMNGGLTSPSGCATLIGFTIVMPTDTIGGTKTVNWSAARAINGASNAWSGIETLNCNVQTPPQECIGQGTTPYLIACGLVTIDPGTWGNLGPCMLGTPADYIRGVGALDEVVDMPLPGSGSCSPFDAGTMFDTELVIDMCSWYPGVRPVIDVLMTAGLWIAVVGSVVRTRTGESS